MDTKNQKHAMWVPRVGDRKPLHRYEVMIPKDEVGHFEDAFMDRTEVNYKFYLD